MATLYSSGKFSIAECDRCGGQYKLRELKPLVVKSKIIHTKVCKECWEPDHPQLLVGLYPVRDPEAVKDPRPDNSYVQSGLTGLRTQTIGVTNPEAVTAFGTPAGGSRQIQWGWRPVGFNNVLQLPGLVDELETTCALGTVTVTIGG